MPGKGTPFVETILLQRRLKVGPAMPFHAMVELTWFTEITENAFCLELALEDKARLREDLTSNIHDALHNDVPPGRLIAQGLELEDHQGQHMHTHSLALLQIVSDCITHGIAKYNEIRAALVVLGPALKKTGWKNILQELTDADLTGITALEDMRSEGSRRISWIWKLLESDAIDGEEKQEALRIEWCKARACGQRWQEECLLLNEEMRRVLTFFTHQDNVWNDRAIKSYPHVDNFTAASLQAYAQRQSVIQRRLRVRCERTWGGLSFQLTTGVGAPIGDQYHIEHRK
ncbi:hypothetical protein C0992_008502 [Termitomyces sp. T32_za158]|nr:hypothetical protein C0992_008502 [Termitomyces sp. T32_za158]